MATKIQLRHPQGKHAISMERVKYETIKLAVINYLKSNGPTTHTDLMDAISEHFKKNKITIAGSLGWHLEWVKLDLESRKEILRLFDSGTLKFMVA
jgi:hypothetical protein